MPSERITRLNPVRDRRRRRATAAALAALLVVIALVATLLSPGSGGATAERPAPPRAERQAAPDAEAEWDPALAEPGSFRVTVDDRLVPDQPFVDGVFEDDAPRPVGRLVGETGEHTDIVLGELVVTTTSDEQLDAFVDRWDAEIVQRLDPQRPGDPDETLVRVDASKAPTDRVAEDLLAIEPHKGEMRVGGDEVHHLLALMASEAAHHGLVVTPNWIQQGTTLIDGEAIEDNDHQNRNAFDWSYLSYNAPLRSGVSAAWQLLAAEGRLGNRVEVMVVDGGFVENPDFPDNTTLRKSQWRRTNEGPCEGGTTCPYHATDVALTAVGQVDNQWGVAGTGGPVSDLIATGNHADDSWSLYRDIEDVVEDERPDILNMSWIGEITVARIAARDRVDRIFRRVQDKGVLPFAGAGNSGKDLYGQSCFIGICWETVLQVPCESQHVVCVAGLKGGRGGDAVERDPGSNYSASDDRRSVELWGPMCVAGVDQPGAQPSYHDEMGVRRVCGTSVSTPFVAGIAALIKAADPSLSPEEIRVLLHHTAHNGGVGDPSDIGSQRRVNAYGAVAAALGVEAGKPSVQIDDPSPGESFSPLHFFELEATATSFTGGGLPVTWESSLDGELGTSGVDGDLAITTLSVGEHTLTATVEDSIGQRASDSVVIQVVDAPPVVQIVGPTHGKTFYEGQDIDLIGWAQDPEIGPLPPESIRWEARREGDGALVGLAGGAVAQLGSLPVGDYEIVLIGNDGLSEVDDRVTIEVLALPDGEAPPTATITAPGPDTQLGTGGADVPIHLEGEGSDPQDGELSGTRMRWTARSQAGTEIVLCEGSNVPGAGGGGGELAVIEDCSEVDTTLGLDPAVAAEFGINPTVWTVTLEVFDSAGLVDEDTVSVTIEIAIP